VANTLTNINGTIIAQDSFEAFKAGLVGTQAFSTGFDAEAGQKMSSVYVPVITARTAGAYSSSYESGDTTITGTQITLDQHYHCASHLTDVEAGKTPVNAFAAMSAEAAYAEGKNIFQAALALFVAATYGDVDGTSKIIKPASSFGIDDVADMIKLLGKRNARGTMSLICDLDYAAALVKDSGVQNAAARGATDVIQDGWFNLPLLGIRVYKTNAFPSALTNESCGAVLVVPSAAGVALRPVYPQSQDAQNAGLFFETVTEEESMLTIGYRQWYNTATGTLWNTYEGLYGVKAIQTAGAVRCVSS